MNSLKVRPLMSRWHAALLVAALSGGMIAHADDVPVTAEPELPVILLTGFQPFGEGRPPNSSWEGIRNLDGREWNGYRLRCLELPVEWGAPLAVLDAQLATLQPVAVFSFGQGRPGYFDLEILGRNQRGDGKDNNDAKPARETVVADGPGHFYNDSVDSLALVRDLSRRGYNMRVSTDAGQYLCEELNYTLQYERSLGKIAGPVLFCHLPPLVTWYGRREVRVSPEEIQTFVLHLLEDWHRGHVAREGASEQSITSATGTAHVTAANDVVARFRAAVAARDVAGCQQLLDPQAIIQVQSRAEPLAVLTVETLSQGGFAESPVSSARTQPPGNTGDPADARLVCISVVTGDAGLEQYTVVRSGDAWRIAHLLLVR